MTRWLLSPLTWFFVAHALVALLDVRIAVRAQASGFGAGYIQNVLFCYLLAAWVQRDARSRRTTFPTDWSMLFCMVFFPIYLLSTRGARGMGMLLLIVAGSWSSSTGSSSRWDGGCLPDRDGRDRVGRGPERERRCSPRWRTRGPANFRQFPVDSVPSVVFPTVSNFSTDRRILPHTPRVRTLHPEKLRDKAAILPIVALMRRIFLALALALSACVSGAEAPKKLPPEKAAPMIDQEIQLLDVRTEEEWNERRLDGAVRVQIGSDDFAEQVKARFDESKPLLVYCRSGRRSARAAKQLEALGFKTVYDLKGGILAWEKDGKKVVK